MQLKDLGVVTTLIKSFDGLTQAEKIAELENAALSDAQKGLAKSMLETSAAAATAGSATSGLSNAFVGLKAVVAAHPILAIATSILLVANYLHRAAEKAREARKEIINAGKNIGKTEESIRDNYQAMLDADNAWKDGTGSKEDLTNATNNLLESLGKERYTVQGLADDYSNLVEKMKSVTAETLAEDREGLLKAAKAAESNLYSYGHDIDPTLYAQQAGRAISDTQKEFSKLLYDELQKRGFNTSINDSGFFTIALDGGTETAGDLLTLWKSAENLKQVMLDIATENGGLKSLYDNQFWKYNQAILDTIGIYASDLDISYKNINDNIAQMSYLNNGTIPKSVEQYNDLRDALIAATIADESFVGSAVDAAEAVDKVLASTSFSKEFAGAASKTTSVDGVIVKANKEFEKFKKNINSLRIDIVKALGEGKTLSDEQNEVFLKWRENIGYTKDQLEEVYKLFQMMYKETPADTITAKTVGDRLRAAREGIQEEQELLAKTQFGNIDMTNRQVIEWTEENLEKYKDAIKSNGLDPEELAGNISTVLGAWDDTFVDGNATIPIAFSPLLQTESGEPELLTDEVIRKYINTLIKKADEAAGKDGWTNEMLFKLDAEGIEIDGKKIKGIIAAVGDEAERVSKIMHFVGTGGEGITPAVQEFIDAYEAANAFAHYYILDDIGDLLTLQDEIKKAGVAWEEYQKILQGGDPEDLAGNMTDALEKALADIKLGRIDTPSIWGAAKLLFSDDKLANELGYDLNRIAEELNSGFIKALFGKPEDEDEVADYAARMSNYLIENADRMKSVDLISDKTTGGFKFMYSSLKELADDMGLTETAATALLKALDAYGIEMMRSSEETRKYIQDYQSLRETGLDAANALDALVTEMAEQDVWEPHALQALQELRDAGVISGDDSEFIEMIKEVYERVEEADRKEAHPEVFLDGVQTVETQARNLWDTLKEIFESEKLQATVELNDQTGNSGADAIDAHSKSFAESGKTARANASGTRDAPGGVTLVNEKGPELISDNGKAYIANGGKPGFTVLSRGAVVFNAEETKAIFRHGYTNTAVNAYANGTGTIGRKSIRDRLIHGGAAKALASGYYYHSCANCGKSISSADNPCPYCGKDPWTKVSTTSSNGRTAHSYAREEYTQQQQQSNHKTCPNCGAWCSSGTSQCGNCGYNFNTGKTPSSNGRTAQSYARDEYLYQQQQLNHKVCPNCGAWCSTGSSKCGNCGYDFNIGTTTYALIKPYNALVPGNPNRKVTQKQNSGGSSGYTGGGGGNYVDDADYGSQAEPEKVDWIAVAINRIQRAVADLEKIASSGFKKLSTRLTAAKKEVGELTKEIDTQQKGYKRYMQEAEGVGLDPSIAKLVQDGTIDITEYDEDVRELIDSYSEWYEKALDCKSAVEELHQEIADLYVTMFNSTQTEFENKLSAIEYNASMINKNMEMAKAKGYMDSVAYYQQLTDVEQDNISMLQEELDGLKSAFNQAMDSGEIEEESEAWYDMQASINSVTEAIADANIELENYKKAMRSVEWGYFDYAQERFGQLQNEANFLIDIMSNDRLFEKNGAFTSKGQATMGLRVQNYNAYMKQADEYANEMRRISKELAENPYDTALIERREALLDLQRQSIQAAEGEKDAIKDLISQGFQKELSNLKDLIDEYENALDSAKSLYDYQKNVSEKSETVAKLQKQVAAYQGDNSEENIARMQKLNEQLKKAREDLAETEMEHNISEQKKLLGEMYDDYEQYLNEKLDNLEALVMDTVSSVNAGSGAISDEIERSAQEVGYTITDGMNEVIYNGVYSYYDKVFDGVTSVNNYLDSIKNMVENIADHADQAAKDAKDSIPSNVTPRTRPEEEELIFFEELLPFSSGGLADYTGPAMLHGTRDRPELVLNAGDTERFLEAAKLMRSPVMSAILDKDFRLPDIGGSAGGITIENFAVDFNLENVSNYDDILRQAQADKRFERLITSITSDAYISGKSKLSKFRQKI